MNDVTTYQEAVSTSLADVIGLRDRAVVIFGCGPGMGLASAARLAGAGARIACVDVKSEVADASQQVLAKGGATAIAVTGDVLDRGSVRNALSTAEAELGEPVGVVLNVVGGARPALFPDITDELWNQQFDFNLKQQFIVAQESIPFLRKSRSGSLIAISSLNGIVSSPGNATYGAAKAGVISIMRSLAIEYAEAGLRVNVIAPGVILTPRILANGLGSGELHERMVDGVPMRKLGSPFDVAGAVFYLASDLSRYITGQIINVDGGAMAKYNLARLL